MTEPSTADLEIRLAYWLENRSRAETALAYATAQVVQIVGELALIDVDEVGSGSSSVSETTVPIEVPLT